MKISDILILSDIDGTLYHEPDPICTRNKQALLRFTEKGGRFALATGRGVQSASHFAEQLPVNAPCILFNGAGVYDYATQTLLASHHLPDFALDYAEKIANEFAQAAVILVNETAMHSVGQSEYPASYLADERTPMIPDRLERARQEKWLKVIFSIHLDEMSQLQEFVAAQNWDDVTFVASAPFFFELLPKGISKATGLVQISELLQIPISNIAAIGDYYNDEQMLRAAGFPVTVSGAPEDIKDICKLVTCSCKDGALADLVEHFEHCCE